MSLHFGEVTHHELVAVDKLKSSCSNQNAMLMKEDHMEAMEVVEWVSCKPLLHNYCTEYQMILRGSYCFDY